MKKHILILMLVILIFTGCQSKNSVQSENQYGRKGRDHAGEAIPMHRSEELLCDR